MHQILNLCQPPIETQQGCVFYAILFDRRTKKGRDQNDVMIVILLTASVDRFQHLRIHHIDGCTGSISDDLVEDI